MKHYSESVVLKLINMIIEYCIMVFSYVISGIMRGYIQGSYVQKFSYEDVMHFLPFILVLSAFMVVCYMVMGDYATIRMYDVKLEGRRVFVLQALFGAVGAALLFLIQGSQFSRVLLGLFVICSAVLLLTKRVFFDRIASRMFGKYLSAYNVLIIGGQELSRRLLSDPLLSESGRYNVIGYLAPIENTKMDGYLGTVDSIRKIVSTTRVDEVYIAEDMVDKDELKSVLTVCGMYGIRSFLIPGFTDYLVGKTMRCTAGGLNFVPVGIMNTSNILGVNIAVTNMEKTIEDISYNLDKWRGKYICVSNVHTTVMAHDDEHYRRVQNGAVMALPDGGPLSSYSRKTGQDSARRVTGPDLMKELLIRSGKAVTENGNKRNYRHFFYGSKQETLDKLKDVLGEKYPDADIAGMISPPFRELTPEEDEEYIRVINEARPDFIWVGLGAPKQEIWMAAHEDRINALMIGVGAAFDYECGNIKRAPKWMQKMNLEWLYRLIQDPKRLLKRYLITNVKYIFLSNQKHR